MTGVADINFKCRSYSTIARWKRTCFSFFVHIISILFIVCVSFSECPSQIQIELSITTLTQLLDFVIQLSLSLSTGSEISFTLIITIIKSQALVFIIISKLVCPIQPAFFRIVIPSSNSRVDFNYFDIQQSKAGYR